MKIFAVLIFTTKWAGLFNIQIYTVVNKITYTAKMAFSAMPVIAVATAKTKARSPMNVWRGIIVDRKFMGNPGYKNAANPATHCVLTIKKAYK